MSTKKESSKAGIWDNASFLNDLAVALYEVGNKSGGFNKQSQTAISEYLTQNGYSTSWEAIR